MKRISAIFITLFISSFLFAEGLSISGNIYTGFRADISSDSMKIYANEDSNGTPIWANVRLDYSLDANAGAVLNFRTKMTDSVSNDNARAYPFLNRGFVWAQSANKIFKVRSGYLWDSDFESSANGWDTASNYEWVTELTTFPIKNLELGVTIPTPWDKADLIDVIKDITYGIVYSPNGLRFSAMGQYGHDVSLQSVNFGIDFTKIKNLVIRIEGDLQQITSSNSGYYQLYQELSYSFGKIVADVNTTETIYKDDSDTLFKIAPNVTFNLDKYTFYSSYVATFTNIDSINSVFKVSGKYAINSKASVKLGSYLSNNSSITTFSPFVEFFAAF